MEWSWREVGPPSLMTGDGSPRRHGFLKGDGELPSGPFWAKAVTATPAEGS